MAPRRKLSATHPRRVLLAAVAMVAAFTTLGGLGYHFIEGWSLSDSFYMVFITLSTVGFSEVHPLNGIGRLWTIFLVVGGVGTVGYTLARGFELLLDGYLSGDRRQRRMQSQIARLEGHFIICGYGRVGRQVVADFRAANRPFVVIDRQNLEDELAEEGFLHIIGNAEQESTLQQAGIERAAGLLAAVDSDTENVFITLTARVLNPKLRVIARASDADSARKLQMVGANRVVSPYVASGKRMAQLALRPQAVDIFDVIVDPLEELAVELQELEVTAGSPMAGHSLRELDLRRRTGVIVVALREGPAITLNPDPDAMIDAGDRMVVLGTRDQCGRLAELNRS